MFEYIVYSFFAAWLVLITYFLIKTRSHYQNLISKTRKNKIDDILDTILEDKNIIQNEIKEISN